MKFLILFFLAGCHSGMSLPQPEGPYEPLNGWDPNALQFTQPAQLPISPFPATPQSSPAQ
jgi:hypothetical protein